VELGLRAEVLLQSNTFKFCVDHLSTQYTNAILTSRPEDRDGREHHYHLHTSLQDLVSQLGVYVAEAHDLMADSEQEGTQEEDE
jgi:hypothetical protein